MAYENYALVLTALSSVILLAGIYYTYVLSRKTGKASVVWYLLSFAFMTLFLYQFAEVVEYGEELVLDSPDRAVELDAGFEDFFKVELGEVAEDVAASMPSVSAAVFVCAAIVIRRSILVPL